MERQFVTSRVQYKYINYNFITYEPRKYRWKFRLPDRKLAIP